MNSRLIKQWCRLSEETLTILRQAMTKFDMSARAYDRIIKVARTIADLDPTNTAADPAFPISPIHMREAVTTATSTAPPGVPPTDSPQKRNFDLRRRLASRQ